MKKVLALLLAAVMVFTAAACGQSERADENNAGKTGTAASGDKTGETAGKEISGEISYMHFGDDYERQMYEDLIKGYMAKNPKAKINQIYTPDDYYTKLQTMISSKTTPDVFWFAEGRTAEYAKAGILEDLTNVYEKYPALVEDLIPSLRKFGQYEGKDIAMVKDWTSYKGSYSTRYDLLMAASMFAMVPILVLYAFCQKYIVKGIVMTGIKG